ncbi:ABC-2 type transport system ATP-binding protein [Candidatus Magnetomoraceae bacterium gMMP-1]
MNEQYIIEVRELGKTYKIKEGRVDALKNLNLKLKKGEILGILGPNGAGKTTAVKMIMGFLRPDKGEIFFKGKKLNAADPRTKIGYLPESFHPNPNLNVYEYIKFQCNLSSAGKKISNHEIKSLLGQVGMEKFLKRRISDLSKGMSQRVGLAQAFAGNPDFLILDEPSSGLDPIGRSEIIEFLLDMKKRGKTIFFCSHILSEVERLCDRIGILVEGSLRFSGKVQEFLEKWNVNNLEHGFKLEAECKTSL